MGMATGGGRGSAGKSAAHFLHPVLEAERSSSINGDRIIAAEGSDGGGGIPPVDDLLSRVMSEVRPWGKRTQDQQGLSSSRQGVFLRRGR